MSKNGITFNGVHSSVYGLDLVSSRRPIFPESKDTYIEIPEKNGSILIPDQTARDIEIEVDFKLSKKTASDLFNTCRDIGNWLTSLERQQLIFDDDPNYYYMGKVQGNITLERMVAFGKFTVVFRCLPYQERSI